MLDRRSFLTSSLAVAAAASLQGIANAAPAAPFKLFDTHTHFYSNNPVKYPFRQDIAAAARDKAMAHPVTPEVLTRLFDAAGVEMGCGVQYNTTYYTDNRYLLDVCEKYPKRFTPVVILAPTDPATPATLKSMAKAYGISGVRFSGPPDAQGNFSFLTEAARGAWETANELGLVIVLMPIRSDQPLALPAAMKRIGELADKYPNVNIVLDHLGFPVIEKTPTFGLSPEHRGLAGRKNVHYKYTTYLIEQLQAGGVSTREFLDYAISVYSADQFVWGSDIGNTEGEYGHLVQLAFESAAGLTLVQKKAMFYGNAKKLFIAGGKSASRHP